MIPTTITDEMIEQAASAMLAHSVLAVPCEQRQHHREAAERALEAVAPLIAAQALRDLADEWREAYSADIFPCSTDDLRHINATSGPNSTAKVAAYFARHWADVLSARAAQVGGSYE